MGTGQNSTGIYNIFILIYIYITILFPHEIYNNSAHSMIGAK